MPGVSQGAGDDLGSSVMAVKTRLGHHDAERLVHEPTGEALLSKTICVLFISSAWRICLFFTLIYALLFVARKDEINGGFGGIENTREACTRVGSSTY